MQADNDDYMKIQVEDVQSESLSYLRNRNKRLNQQMAKGVVESEKSKMARQLDELLSRQIPVENKGFKMLEKMGFRKGQRLGKDGDGLAEPIAINVKQDKGGVGKKKNHAFESQKEKSERQNKFESGKSEFLMSSKSKLEATRLEKDLAMARKTCMTLDGRDGKSRSAFWPIEHSLASLPSIDGYSNSEPVQNIVDSDFESQSLSEKLDTLVFYLRNCYHYCLWCSIEYENAQDLLENCPGEVKNDHDDLE